MSPDGEKLELIQRVGGLDSDEMMGYRVHAGAEWHDTTQADHSRCSTETVGGKRESRRIR